MKKIKNKNSLTQHFGNLLIVLSILLVIFIYFPILSLYLIPQKKMTVKTTTEFTITIPSINAQAKVISNVSPWDQAEYRSALEKGVAHAKGSYLPNQKGTVFLFAHSSDTPWHMTRTNTPFVKLSQIKMGEKIFLSKDGKLYSYKVVKKITVSPSDVSFLEDLSPEQLLLQTCTPPGTALKRLIVFAEKI